MSKRLTLSPEFSMDPMDYAGQGNAILGIRDAGKSYTAMKAAEELLEAGIPIIVYDPVGVWKNLKIGANGHKGYPVVVAGGPGSDIILNTHNAVDIVKAAMKAGISLIIDLYSRELINKATWIKIVQETIDLLMYENEPYGMRHIFLEEAAEFIPQKVQPQHGKVYASIERLARMGRNARLGYTLINQRAEEVNKAILEISEMMILHRQVGKNSLNSIKKWLELQSIENADEIRRSMPALKSGQCWIISSARVLKIQVAQKKTFHPNPKRKEDPGKHESKKVDVSTFVTKLNQQLISNLPPVEAVKKVAVSAGASQNEEISSLKKQLFNLQAINTQHEKELVSLRQLLKQAEEHIRSWQNWGAEILDNCKKMPTGYKFAKLANTGELSAKTISIPNIPAKHVNELRQLATTSPPMNKPGGSKSANGSVRMLQAAALFYPCEITRARMAAIARLSAKSGSFSTYLSSLNSQGYLQTVSKDVYKITELGMSSIGDVEPLPSTTAELTEMWCNIIGVNSGAARMLRALVDIYPDSYTKFQLGDRVKMSYQSGSFSTYLSVLNRNGLIAVQKDIITAASELFIV